MLQRDTSMFFDMFEFGTEAGISEENPLILRDDTVDDFRALCWVLYAL